MNGCRSWCDALDSHGVTRAYCYGANASAYAFDVLYVDGVDLRDLPPSGPEGEAQQAHPTQALECALPRPYPRQGRRGVRAVLRAGPGGRGGQAQAQSVPGAGWEADVGESEEPGLLPG